MGMYTVLNLSVELKKNTPQNVIDTLNHMLRSNMEDMFHTKPEHPLFNTQRWDHMLKCDSYYFAEETQHTFHLDPISKQYYLTVITNLKDYDGEIEKFLNWIKPYVEPRGFAGYSRYEESEEPKLIYFTE